MSKASPEDCELFREAVKDAIELRAQNRAEPARPKPRIRRGASREEIDAPTAVSGPMPGDFLDETSFCRSGVSLKKLRRDRPVAEDELDLHGVNIDHAWALLRRFMQSAHGRELRSVRIIHGKGYRSKDGVAVLKPMVRSWLMADASVLAFHEASLRDGGGGALVVYLKSR